MHSTPRASAIPPRRISASKRVSATRWSCRISSSRCPTGVRCSREAPRRSRRGSEWRGAGRGRAGPGEPPCSRALAARWPYGRGHIGMPAHDQTMFLPQQPYLPIGTLRAALEYPSADASFSDERIREVLGLVGLSDLASQLDTSDHWENRLSVGEQ